MYSALRSMRLQVNLSNPRSCKLTLEDFTPTDTQRSSSILKLSPSLPLQNRLCCQSCRRLPPEPPLLAKNRTELSVANSYPFSTLPPVLATVTADSASLA
ncbi:hypothetical protein VTI28DRAFT_9519 [Corynascus sepedonium]